MRTTIAKLLIVLFFGLALLLVATSHTYTPPFRNADGSVVETSIAEERRMILGGVEQYVLIRGKDRSAPLLVFLHGGPGYSAMPFNRLRNAGLERDFVFVNWDQRGAGYSVAAAKDIETLTLDRITRDLDELIDSLRVEFEQEQVMLIGHSWGSLLGLEYISRHPEKIAAYIGISQFSDVPESEAEGYDWALAEARKIDADGMIKALEQIGRPPYDTVDEMWTQRRALNKLGGVWFEPKPDYYYAVEYLRAREFSWPGLTGLLRGGELSMENLFATAYTANAFDAYPELQAPVFFIEGRHDHVVSTRLAATYLDVLAAPHKELIWFERSGHMPNWEEPEKFNEEVVRIARQIGMIE